MRENLRIICIRNIMYFYNMFSVKSIYFIVSFGCLILISCQNNSNRSASETSPYEVVIQHSTGDDYIHKDEELTFEYMAYPFNVGYVRGRRVDHVKCILLSKKMSARSRATIKPIGVFQTLEQDTEISYIIAVPTDEQKRSVKIDNFSDLVTKHNAIKNIIELWVLNRCGMGCVENLSWGNENTATFVIESIKES